MTATSALLAGRRAAERLMLDTCTVSEAGTFDPESGEAVPGAPLYSGRCKVGGDRPYESSPEAGGATVTVQRFTLHVPADAGPFEVGQVVRITASAMQSHLVGNEYRIAGPDERSSQTSQRMFIDLVS